MISKVKWNHHVVLGNLILDFSKPEGGIYSTILLAGENGTGKTTILDTLSVFLNLGSANPFEYIRPLAKLGKAVKIANASNQRKAKGKPVSAVTIAFREDAKPFDKSDSVFNKDALP